MSRERTNLLVLGSLLTVVAFFLAIYALNLQSQCESLAAVVYGCANPYPYWIGASFAGFFALMSWIGFFTNK
jgi:hypothetical protein